MGPFRAVEFSIVELPDELQIRRVRHAGWIERILAPAVVPALMGIGWLWQKPSLIVGASVLLMLLIVAWAWGHPSVLRVLPDRLITSAFLWNTMETALSDIETVQWLRGEMFVENGDPDGLYISCAGRCKCVLPFVSEEQAEAATDAISRRFPKYPVKVPVPGSFRFEGPPDLTAFTLRGPTEPDTNEKT
jgi:hypothetical protein